MLQFVLPGGVPSGMKHMMNKLKTTEIKSYREQQLSLQNSCCDLCAELVLGDAVLDHDHKTGLVRKVLHRGCNSMLGKIENNMARSQMDIHRLRTWATNLVDYIQTTHTDIVHPTHLRQKRKPKTKRAKNANTKSTRP
jgi:hypothetical protein